MASASMSQVLAAPRQWLKREAHVLLRCDAFRFGAGVYQIQN